jgi:hypothetical protein
VETHPKPADQPSASLRNQNNHSWQSFQKIHPKRPQVKIVQNVHAHKTMPQQNPADKKHHNYLHHKDLL